MSLKVTACLVVLSVVLGIVAAAPQPISMTASVTTSLFGSKEATDSKVTGPDGITRGTCVFTKDDESIKVTYQETASGNITAQVSTNSTSAEDAVEVLKECRTEVTNVAQKVASTSNDIEVANSEFTKKFTEINKQMEETMKELKHKVEKAKGEDEKAKEDDGKDGKAKEDKPKSRREPLRIGPIGPHKEH